MPEQETKSGFINRTLSSKRLSSKTVYNPANSIYNKLTKFFSGPINRYKVPDIANPKRQNMQKFGYTDIFGTPFKRQDEYYRLNQAQSEQNLNALRLQRYMEFENAEMSPPEISKALDIYAGEVTTYTDYSPLLKIISPKDEIKEILHDLFYDILGIEQNLFDWTRTLCKFGDLFLFLDINPEEGVVGAQALPVFEIERLEGVDVSNPDYVQFQWNAEGLTFENVEIAHFRIKGNEKFWPYGCSVLYPARKIIKQLNLMIEQMMSYRIVRAPERLVFYYDVTGLESDKVEAFIEKNISNTQRQSVTNKDNGNQDLLYNAMEIGANYHVPIRKGSETKIDTLPGGQFVGDIEDVELLRDQLFTALGIPGSYMSNKNNDGEAGSLVQKSMLFARAILRIDNAITSELRKIAMVHLLTLGYSGKDLLDFDLKLNNPSKLAEMQEYEHLKLKFEVASSAADQGWSKRKIQKELWGWSPEEIHRNTYEIFGDAKLQMMISNIENQAGATGEGGGFAGLGPSGMSGGAGEIDGLDQMMGGEQPGNPEDEFQDVEGGGEQSSLLVKPGEGGGNPAEQARRKDAYLTPGAKGHKYSPAQSDFRGSAQRRNSINSVSGRNSIRATNKNIFSGNAAMKSFSKGIYPESVQEIENNNVINENQSLIMNAESALEEIQELLKETKKKGKSI